MTRKKANPADSLARFMYGIYDYFHDRGMPQKTAKARMMDSALEVCSDIIKKEEEIPDHMLVIMTQFLSKSLDTRGFQLTKAIKMQSSSTEADLQPLRDLKELKDATDKFIENYKGWDIDGSTSKKDS